MDTLRTVIDHQVIKTLVLSISFLLQSICIITATRHYDALRCVAVDLFCQSML